MKTTTHTKVSLYGPEGEFHQFVTVDMENPPIIVLWHRVPYLRTSDISYTQQHYYVVPNE